MAVSGLAILLLLAQEPIQVILLDLGGSTIQLVLVVMHLQLVAVLDCLIVSTLVDILLILQQIYGVNMWHERYQTPRISKEGVLGPAQVRNPVLIAGVIVDFMMFIIGGGAIHSEEIVAIKY